MRTPVVLPVVTLLLGLALGVVLSSPGGRGKPGVRDGREEMPAEAGVRIVAKPVPPNETGPVPVHPAYTFDDLGHHYVLTVTPDGVTVSRLR